MSATVTTAQRAFDDALSGLLAAGTILAIAAEEIADPVVQAALHQHTEAKNAYEAAHRSYLDAMSIERATQRSIAAIAREGTRS